MLSVIDEYTRECLAIHVKRKLNSRKYNNRPDLRYLADMRRFVSLLRLEPSIALTFGQGRLWRAGGARRGLLRWIIRI